MPDTETTIQPALTPEEWTARVASRADMLVAVNEDGELWCENPGQRDTLFSSKDMAGLHAITALAQYGQPFGFTREDVQTLRRLSRQVVVTREYPDGTTVNALENLADRIAALLPEK